MLGFDMRPQAGQVGLGDPRRRAAGDFRLYEGTGLEDLGGIADGGLGDRGAAVTPDLQQAAVGQGLQGGTDHRAAGAVDLADLVFRQPGAGLQPVLDDGVLQAQADLQRRSRRFGWQLHPSFGQRRDPSAEQSSGLKTLLSIS